MPFTGIHPQHNIVVVLALVAVIVLFITKHRSLFDYEDDNENRST